MWLRINDTCNVQIWSGPRCIRIAEILRGPETNSSTSFKPRTDKFGIVFGDFNHRSIPCQKNRSLKASRIAPEALQLEQVVYYCRRLERAAQTKLETTAVRTRTTIGNVTTVLRTIRRTSTCSGE